MLRSISLRMKHTCYHVPLIRDVTSEQLQCGVIGVGECRARDVHCRFLEPQSPDATIGQIKGAP